MEYKKEPKERKIKDWMNKNVDKKFVNKDMENIKEKILLPL